MYKINILGLGPGNKNYILPIVMEKIRDSDVIIGGKRNVESVQDEIGSKEILYIKSDLSSLTGYIKSNRHKKISVIVSGDTGFYSFLTFLKKHFSDEELLVIPGISSVQYMFARISDYWYDAYVGSVHGKEFDFIEKLKECGKLALLTDNKNTPQEIAKELVRNGMNDTLVCVGENLSYEDERIYRYKAGELVDLEQEFGMNVVVLKRG